MGLGPNSMNKTYYISKVSKCTKRIVMLTSLKVSSLVCKCVFYGRKPNAKGDHIELNFKGLEMEKRNIPIGRVQRIDEKNGVICVD